MQQGCCKRSVLLVHCCPAHVQAFDDAGDHLTNAEVRQAAANGNAGFSQQAYGPGTMFSAAAAGAAVAPGFQQYAPVPTQDVRDTKLIDYGDI